MIISLVVAAAQNNVIGKDNKLLWHLPNDLRFFKNTTWAMPVIMGRKTFESFHNKPLNGRFNIVVTRQTALRSQGKIWLANNLETGIDIARKTDCREAFVIGGGELYKEAMSIADKIYITRVETMIEGDTYFPAIDTGEWLLTSSIPFPADEKHAYAYSFQLWERRTV